MTHLDKLPLGLGESREAIESACAAVGVQFPTPLLDHYEGRARRKFEAHSWTWESRRPLVLLSARWVGRLAGELALRDGRRTVAGPDAELAFTIARDVCYARAPLCGHRLDWCPDGPPGTGQGRRAEPEAVAASASAGHACTSRYLLHSDAEPAVR